MRPINSVKCAPLLLALCLTPHPARGALAQQTGPTAQKFDEFTDIQYSDLIARLDNLANQLQNDPSMRAFLVVYRSRRDLPGLSARLANRMRSYLIYARGLAPARVVTVDGGEASCLSQELWLVPPGAAPTPRADAYQRNYVDLEAARKFDESGYALPTDYEGAEYGDSVAAKGPDPEWLAAYAAALRREPRALAYVIAYPQHYIARWEEETEAGRVKTHRRVHADPPATSARMLRAVKAELVRQHGIAPARVRVVDGGYRSLRALEFWIVPRGVRPPVATPNAYPPRRAPR